MSDFNHVIDRKGSGALKWDKYRGRDIIPMWVADMDFSCPPPVLEVLRKRVDHGVFGYALPPDELIEILVRRFQDTYGWPIDKEWLVWLPGVVPALAAACDAFLQPGQQVVTLTPIYPPFLNVPAYRSAQLVTAGLAFEENRYTIDVEAFEKALTAETKLFFLCQPHNPVGRVFNEKELMPILALCREKGIIVCSDEIHCDLILSDRKHRPVAALTADAPDYTITLMSPGKTFNTAGLNMAFAVVPNPDLRRKLLRASHYILPYPNCLGYTAALAAYRDGEQWRRQLIAALSRNADRVYQCVNTEMKGLSTTQVEATYLAWLDARALKHPNPWALFRDYGVALSDGAEFGAPGFVRLNFACPGELLEKGLFRIKQACERAGSA